MFTRMLEKVGMVKKRLGEPATSAIEMANLLRTV